MPDEHGDLVVAGIEGWLFVDDPWAIRYRDPRGKIGNVATCFDRKAYNKAPVAQ
ncbi:MAG: hypothetical protein H6817_07465 [Phycisphaerales bacterium]|nr:hypothetical protein [Phycisphaerales bacterium]